MQDAGLHVEDPLVGVHGSVAHVERFVVDEQSDELAVGHVDHALARLGVAVGRLGIGQGQHLAETGQVGA